LRATAQAPDSPAALQQQARKSGADRLTLEEIEEEIAAVRGMKTPDENKESV
jgi:hypothetical protein